MQIDSTFLLIGGALFVATLAAFFNLVIRWAVVGVRIVHLMREMRKCNPSIPPYFSPNVLRMVGRQMKVMGRFDDEHVERIRQSVIDARTLRRLTNSVWLVAAAQMALVVFVCVGFGEWMLMAIAIVAVFGFFVLFVAACRYLYGKIRAAFSI